MSSPSPLIWINVLRCPQGDTIRERFRPSSHSAEGSGAAGGVTGPQRRFRRIPGGWVFCGREGDDAECDTRPSRSCTP